MIEFRYVEREVEVPIPNTRPPRTKTVEVPVLQTRQMLHTVDEVTGAVSVMLPVAWTEWQDVPRIKEPK